MFEDDISEYSFLKKPVYGMNGIDVWRCSDTWKAINLQWFWRKKKLYAICTEWLCNNPLVPYCNCTCIVHWNVYTRNLFSNSEHNQYSSTLQYKVLSFCNSSYVCNYIFLNTDNMTAWFTVAEYIFCTKYDRSLHLHTLNKYTVMNAQIVGQRPCCRTVGYL